LRINQERGRKGGGGHHRRGGLKPAKGVCERSRVEKKGGGEVPTKTRGMDSE